MGVSKRTERVLSEAEIKVSKAEEAMQEYQLQKQGIQEKNKQLEEENEQLRASILSNALQNASSELKKEYMQLKQTLESYQSKVDQMKEISLLSAKVVDRYYLCL
jgi:FtsZ-binding cell division protein ZapB